MPTIPNIRTSIENQFILIRDSHAKNGQFLRDTRGRLVSYSGGFTVVYPYTLKGEKWAFRCWHANLGNVRKRFETISNVIQQSKLSYLLDFIYVDEGVVVDGIIYPTTRMRWVEGLNIKDYICKHKNSKSRLLTLADKFLTLTNDMHRHKFAHGDLQHGNIIVNDKGELFLVDYDSFYCPTLKGEPDIITGLKDYQHPSRKNNKMASEKLDYFSELVIYLSIIAIAEEPSLVDKYRVTDSEHMLFTSEDFEHLKSSLIYKDLRNLSNKTNELLIILDNYLSEASMDKLKPFSEQLNLSSVSSQMLTTTKSCPPNLQQTATKVKAVKLKKSDTVESIEQEIKLELAKPHFSYKNIPIKGTLEEMKRAFQHIGQFQDCSKHRAHIVGELFGFPNVYVRFEEGEKGVNAIHFIIPFKCGDLKTIYKDFKTSLSTKYGAPKTEAARKVEYALDLGHIELMITESHVELIYADDLTKYAKIEELKAKLHRIKYLKQLQDDI